MEQNYESPVVDTMAVEIEKGFAGSTSLEGYGDWESGVGTN